MVKKSPHRNSIIELHRKGIKQSGIAARLMVAKSVVSETLSRYKELGSNADRAGRGKKVTKRTKSNIKKVKDRFRYKNEQSQRRVASKMKISRRTMGRIVTADLGLKAYKFSKGQLLTVGARKKREERATDLLHRFSGIDYRNILFTDEKVFSIEHFVNKQNDRIYAKTQPNKVITRSGYPKSVMVFAGITYDGKTPLMFVPEGIKVNGENYLDILQQELQPWAQKHFRNKVWTFQQDGAPAHKARKVQQWCAQNFPGFINFNQWPPSSPDLNPMDYSVWSVLESKACKKNHSSIDALKKSLEKAWNELDVSYLSATIEDFPRRLQECIAAKGGLFEKK